MDVTKVKCGDVILGPVAGVDWGVVEHPNRGTYAGEGKYYKGVNIFHPNGKTEVIVEKNILPTATIAPSPKEYYELLRKGYTADIGTADIGNSGGADPEIFAIDAAGDVIPAFEFLPGKANPVNYFPVPTYTEPSTSAFYDGFQAEFTIKPSTCHGYVTDHVRYGLQLVLKEARKYNPAARLSIDSVLPITKEMLAKAGKEYVKLGCAPSRNAYHEEPLAVPAAEELEMRFAGAHMHFGGTSIPAERVDDIVKFMDAVAGVAMVGMGEGYTCPDRRKYYGRAGEYRFHYQGPASTPRLEYRVPDTVLLSHPAPFNAVWDFTRVVFRMGVLGLNFLWDAGEDEVREAINENNVKLARDILVRNGNIFRRIIQKANPGWGTSDGDWSTSMVKLFMEGIGEVVADPRAVERNWMLDQPEGKYTTENEAKTNPPSMDEWSPESYGRKPEFWPTGKIWSSAAMKVMKGERV